MLNLVKKTDLKNKLPGPLCWVALVALMFVVGCQSSKPGSSSHAAVEIKGHPAKEIEATTVVVFAEKGFTLRTNSPGIMLFDRPATSGEKVKYGDWLNEGMLMQVKVRLQSQADEAYLLRADVYSVQDPLEPVFRQERRVVMFSSSYYQKLLEDVASRLNSPKFN